MLAALDVAFLLRHIDQEADFDQFLDALPKKSGHLALVPVGVLDHAEIGVEEFEEEELDLGPPHPGTLAEEPVELEGNGLLEADTELEVDRPQIARLEA